MYNFIRKTHLFTALALFVFILMYAVSGYVLEFPNAWKLGNEDPTMRNVPINYSIVAAAPDSPESIAYVKEAGDLHGKTLRVYLDKKNAAWNYYFMGAGGYDIATLPKNADQIAIKSSRAGFYAMLNRMHHLAGFDGGGIYQIWGVMFDLVCVAMILFSFSGIYLWYKLTKRHALGWIILTLSIAYTSAMAVYCLCAR